MVVNQLKQSPKVRKDEGRRGGVGGAGDEESEVILYVEGEAEWGGWDGMGFDGSAPVDGPYLSAPDSLILNLRMPKRGLSKRGYQ